MRLFSFGLRGSGLVARALVILVLARYLDVDGVAEFGLLAATIAYAVFPLGLDFYTYSNRSLVEREREQRATVLISHLAVLCCAYVVGAAALLAYLVLVDVSAQSLVALLVILPLEHLLIESERVLTILHRQVQASVLLFIRSGLWPILVVIQLWYLEDQRSLTTVLATWAAVDALAVILALLWVRKLGSGWLHSKVDRAWIRAGIRVATTYLAATILVRTFFIADRYVFDAVAATEVFAAYTVYLALAGSISAGVGAGIHAFLYPTLVTAAARADTITFDATVRKMWWQTGLAVASTSVLISVAFLVVDEGGHLSRTYTDHPGILAITVLGAAIFNFSLIPHYQLYAHAQDRAMFQAAVWGTCTFGSALLIALAVRSPIVAAFSVALGSTTLLICKQWFARRPSVKKP